MPIIVKMPEDTPIRYRALVEQLISSTTSFVVHGIVGGDVLCDELDDCIAEILDDHEIPYDREEPEDI